MIDFHKLKAWDFPVRKERYAANDVRLYALGLNVGQDPMDPRQLRHVAAEPPVTLMTMAAVMCRVGGWMRAPETGITYEKIVVGGVSLRAHRPLPCEGEVIGTHKVLSIEDKGASRGAIVTVRRTIQDADSGDVLAEFDQATFCRADGGFSNGDGTSDASVATAITPDRTADHIFEHATQPQQALIYRLTGDMNPLHSDPDVARRAGFERPILHGLATFGIAGWSLISALMPDQPDALRALGCRMSAPVFPGDKLITHIWHREGDEDFQFETFVGERKVLSHGFGSIIPNSV